VREWVDAVRGKRREEGGYVPLSTLEEGGVV
jgi:hypothetical protein